MITNMTAITLADGQVNTANHTFSPASNGADGVCRWLDREHNSGVSIGFSTLTFSVREPIKAGGPSRVKLSISIPKLDTSTVVPTLIGVGSANVEFIFPGAYTLADRRDLRAFLMNACGVAALGENIYEMQRPY